MNNRVLITAAAVALSVFTGGWLGLALGEHAASQARLPQEGVPQEGQPLSQATPGAAPTQGTYVVREYEGKVAVFVGGDTQPGMVLDVYVSYLPEADRRLLETGIAVEDYPKLVRLLEDYAS